MPLALTTTRSPLITATGGLVVMAVSIGIGRFVYTPILPPMVAGLGLSKAAAGLIASANFAGYLAGALATAWVRLPGSRRAWVLAALVASALSTGAMGYTTSLPAFLVLRFLGGVVSALGLILSSALVLDELVEAGRADLASMHFGGVGVGIAISAVLVAGLQADGADWAVLWQASGATSLLAALTALGLLPIGHKMPRPASHVGGRAPVDPRLLRLTLAYGLFGFGYVITATFMVAIVRGTPAIRDLEPVIWVIVGLAATPSVAVWVWLSRRIGLGRAYAVAALAEAVGVMASVAWPTATGIFVASVLLGGTFMGLTSLGLMQARELARGDAGRVMAMVTVAFGLGQIIGPSLAGVLSDALGGFLVPSALAAGGLVIAAGLVCL